MSNINFDQLDTLRQGHFGVIDVPCPTCGPDRRSAANRRRKVLRLWCDCPNFITYCCARCEVRGYAHDGTLGSDRSSTVPDKNSAAKIVTPDDCNRSEFPLRIWADSVSAEYSPLLKYLTYRRLTLPDQHNGVLRFHPSCPFGEGVRHPCMIALFRDIRTNEPKAIHRTALTPDGRKIGRKSLGPIGGCAIKLTPDGYVEHGLTIGEGVETTLAGMELNFRPAWAVGSAGAIAKFPLLTGIECLTILVDHDAGGAGQDSAVECSRHWTSMGREVLRVIPTMIDTDMADVFSGVAA